MACYVRRHVRVLSLLLLPVLCVAQGLPIGIIQVYGNRKVSEAEIRKHLGVREGDVLPRSKGDTEERLADLSGVVEANLPKLLELVDDAQLSFVPGLIARKLAGPEQSQLAEVEVEFHARHYERLREQLRLASERSALPEAATAGPALHDLLLRLRGVS